MVRSECTSVAMATRFCCVRSSSATGARWKRFIKSTRSTCRSDSPTTSIAYQRTSTKAPIATSSAIETGTRFFRGRGIRGASPRTRARAPALVVGPAREHLARQLVGQLDRDLQDVDDALVGHQGDAQEHVVAAPVGPKIDLLQPLLVVVGDVEGVAVDVEVGGVGEDR